MQAGTAEDRARGIVGAGLRRRHFAERGRGERMLSNAQLLDELMGRDRNLAPDEKRQNVRWDDDSVSPRPGVAGTGTGTGTGRSAGAERAAHGPGPAPEPGPALEEGRGGAARGRRGISGLGRERSPEGCGRCFAARSRRSDSPGPRHSTSPGPASVCLSVPAQPSTRCAAGRGLHTAARLGKSTGNGRKVNFLTVAGRVHS